MDYELMAPPINIEDYQEISDTLVKTSNSLLIGETQGWIEKKQAALLFAMMASRLGQKVEIAEELQEERESKPKKITASDYGRNYGH